jgi:hypothetical protein
MGLGTVWFGPLFGKAWMEGAGMTPEMMERAKSDPAMKRKMMRSYAIVFVLALVMAFVLAHSIIFAGAYLGVSGLSAGLQGAFWSWLGFVVPSTIGAVLWEGKSWKYWMIVVSHWLVLLLIMGVVLSLWR